MTTLVKLIFPHSIFSRLVYWRDRLKVLAVGRSYRKGVNYTRRWSKSELPVPSENTSDDSTTDTNPLWEYFDANTEGPEIWKWKHYFEIYHQHLARFVDKKIDMLEIGIFGGGNLGMWKSYFGSDCRIYGIHIEPACKTYESDPVSIYIGDQEDPTFWDSFTSDVPYLDTLIDDGGHTPEQQIVTLEKMLPSIRPGGVYICEDVHAVNHRFAAYAEALVN